MKILNSMEYESDNFVNVGYYMHYIKRVEKILKIYL